jgi:hypothetical protein
LCSIGAVSLVDGLNGALKRCDSLIVSLQTATPDNILSLVNEMQEAQTELDEHIEVPMTMIVLHSVLFSFSRIYVPPLSVAGLSS